MSTLTKTLVAVLTAMLVGGAAYVAAAPGGHDAAMPPADVKGADAQTPGVNQANEAGPPHHAAEARDPANNEVADQNEAADDNDADEVGQDQDAQGDDNDNQGPGSESSGPGNTSDRGEPADNSGPGSQDSGRDGGDSGSSHSGSGDSGSGSGGHGGD